MLKSQVFQYYTEKLWEKIKTTFMSKNDAINGVILDYKWKLVKSSINDVSIFLPSLDDIDEIYIEMNSPDSVILHQVTVKKDGLIPVGSNATSKEILLDGVFDYQTYVTYDVATNKITPSVFEGSTIDSTTSITTSVYVKEHIESDITVPAGSIAYDNSTSGMVSEDVQGAIDELYEMKSSGGLAPRQVSKVFAIKGSASIDVNWDAPNTYDVDCVKYNVYVYSDSTAPTSFSQFSLVTSTTELSYEYTMPDTSADYYFLIASVSKDDVIQESIDYIAKAITVETFANTSWETVFEIGKMGLQSTYFSIGDERTISIGGTSYKVKITDFNHDDLADGSGKAPYTFSMSNAALGTIKMNSSDTNVGGWGESSMFKYMDTLLTSFPSELQELIRPVIKNTSAGNQSTSIVESTNKLWLFSEVEVFGYTNNSFAGEGSQYPIFTSNSSRIKNLGDSGSACDWWLRSPYASGSSHFCHVYVDGETNYGGASYARGVSVGFCF